MISRPHVSARQYRRANRTCSLTPDSQPIPGNETRSDYSVSLFLLGGTIRQDHQKKKSDKISFKPARTSRGTLSSRKAGFI